jgi:hypothetical protein
LGKLVLSKFSSARLAVSEKAVFSQERTGLNSPIYQITHLSIFLDPAMVVETSSMIDRPMIFRKKDT